MLILELNEIGNFNKLNDFAQVIQQITNIATLGMIIPNFVLTSFDKKI